MFIPERNKQQRLMFDPAGKNLLSEYLRSQKLLKFQRILAKIVFTFSFYLDFSSIFGEKLWKTKLLKHKFRSQ